MILNSIAIGLLFVAFLFVSCQSVPSSTNLPNGKYCFSDHYHDLSVHAHTKGDTFFIEYVNVLDQGQYINGPFDDAHPFAGWTLLSDIKGKQVTIDILNYRHPEERYELLLMADTHQTVTWKISDESVSFLPKEATLVPCNQY